MLVIFRHGRVFLEEDGKFLHAVTSMLQRGGWVGVDLFFTLSGFLVSGLIYSEMRHLGSFRPGYFLVRRAFKIYPSFWFFLAVSVLGGLVLPLPKLTVSKILSEFFFVQNYFGGLWQHTWSLAVEEHFYLILTFMCWLFGNPNRVSGRQFLPLALSSILIVCYGLRIANRPAVVVEEWSLFPTHLRLDSLAAGALLAYAWHFGKLKTLVKQGRWTLVSLAVGVILLAPPFFVPVKESPFIVTHGLTLNYIGSCLLILGMIGLNLTGRFCAAISLLGSNSYNIYLWHIPAAGLSVSIARRLMPQAKILWVEYCIYISAAIIVGIAMTRFIETPVLRLRDRIIPSRSRSAV